MFGTGGHPLKLVFLCVASRFLVVYPLLEPVEGTVRPNRRGLMFPGEVGASGLFCRAAAGTAIVPSRGAAKGGLKLKFRGGCVHAAIFARRRAARAGSF